MNEEAIGAAVQTWQEKMDKQANKENLNQQRNHENDLLPFVTTSNLPSLGPSVALSDLLSCLNYFEL